MSAHVGTEDVGTEDVGTEDGHEKAAGIYFYTGRKLK